MVDLHDLKRQRWLQRRDANRRVALGGGRGPKPASHESPLIKFTQSGLEGTKGWRLEAARLALGRDGTQQVAHARLLGLEVNPLRSRMDYGF
jgi:hypothetical protein